MIKHYNEKYVIKFFIVDIAKTFTKKIYINKG